MTNASKGRTIQQYNLLIIIEILTYYAIHGCLVIDVSLKIV